MGINDRDYMKDDDSDILDLNALAIKVVKMVVVLLLLAISLRFPMVWLKLGLALVVVVWGIRWIFKPRQRNRNRQPSKPPAMAGQEGAEVVRQLVQLDAAGEFGKVKTLIQSLDGQEFPDSVANELASLAKNYFPVEVEKTEAGSSRFKLS